MLTTGRVSATTELGAPSGIDRRPLSHQDQHGTLNTGRAPVKPSARDVTERDVLHEAEITDAGTVVLALPDDTAAIFATFAIRELNPGTEIITRANEHESVSKLYRAGAD